MRRLFAALLLTSIAAVGCGGESSDPVAPPPADDDRTLIGHTLSLQSSLIDAEVPAIPDSVYLRGGRPGTEAVVPPLRRRITSVDRTLAFSFSDPDTNGRPTRAVVTVHKRLHGTAEIVIEGAASRGTRLGLDAATFTRTIDDLWTRVVALRRITDVDSMERLASPWIIVGLSPVDMRSVDHLMDCATCGTTSITSLRLHSGALDDLTIHDPSGTLPLDGIFPVLPGAQVVITAVVTKDGDFVGLGYLTPIPAFTRTAPSTYVADLHAPEEPGIYHVPVSVQDLSPFASGTLDAVTWLVPIRVLSVATPVAR